MELGREVQSVVVQPTTVCNVNCSYCYLPSRDQNLVMSDEVATAIARSLADHCETRPINIIWHGGEPTATGITRFKQLLEIFDRNSKAFGFRHGIQTNATLINDAWCALIRERKISIGVSVDGPDDLNSRRVTRTGASTHQRAMAGIQKLNQHQLPYNAIAVVGRDGLKQATRIYEFFSGLGCYELGINLEESEGVHTDGLDAAVSDVDVLMFWSELWAAWRKSPSLAIREIRQVIDWMNSLTGEAKPAAVSLDPFPTVGWDGSITFLSPELLGGRSAHYDNFVAGNVLTHDLYSAAASAIDNLFVSDFLRGVQRCETTCEYFAFCKGGQASNKFYETGSTNATETSFCRHGAMRLIDASVQVLETNFSEQKA